MQKNRERAKVSQGSEDSKVGASSCGPATSGGEAPRSRGGAPIAPESGDSVPGVAKTKIEDSAQGESKDQKEKKNKTGEE